ncbi:hypothetical protein ACS0TY_028632 [Phlomoides rotata]
MEGLRKTVGNGRNTWFWEDKWVGNFRLRDKFPRLYNLCQEKSVRIWDVGEWMGDTWVWKWGWRRNLRDREMAILLELSDLIDRYPLKREEKDKWRWEPEPNGTYTTRSVYEWLTTKDDGTRDNGVVDNGFNLVWNKLSPLKVAFHAWRVLWERLPTKTNLQRRNSLPPNVDVKCVFCESTAETVRHIFFECEFSHKVWMECCNWLGVVTVLPSNPTMNQLHFSSFLRGRRGRIDVVCVWEGIVWTLWKWRNSKFFKGIEVSVNKIVDEIKARLWSWIGIKGTRWNNFGFED